MSYIFFSMQALHFAKTRNILSGIHVSLCGHIFLTGLLPPDSFFWWAASFFSCRIGASGTGPNIEENK